MEDKLMLGDFISNLRKEKNLSQSELGELVGVSNKAVSKWETLEANPDLNLIKKLAEVLGVTTDELLSCERAELKDDGECKDYFLSIKGKVNRTSHSYEFVSDKKTRKGTPYLHINLGTDKNGKVLKAKGIVALGIISQGIISMGILSMGILSFGVLAIGLGCFGALSLGLLLSLGGVAAGIGVSAGGVAIGAIAIGGLSIGIISVGGLSIGVLAHTGAFGKAIGLFCYYH